MDQAMTVQELIDALQASIYRGLPPTTTVVVESGSDFELQVIECSNDPTLRQGYDLWFTLFPGAMADSRVTPGGLYE